MRIRGDRGGELLYIHIYIYIDGGGTPNVRGGDPWMAMSFTLATRRLSLQESLRVASVNDIAIQGSPLSH
jgi:hypothetical protein